MLTTACTGGVKAGTAATAARHPHYQTANFCRVLALILLTSSIQVLSAGRVSYNGHAVLRVWPETPSQIALVHSLPSQHNQPMTSQQSQIDLWRHPSKTNRSADIRVSAELLPVILHRLRRSSVAHQVSVSDLQSKIDEEHAESTSSVAPPVAGMQQGAPFNLSIYHTFQEIMDWMDGLAEECGPLCATVKIGTSYEGRTLKAIRIGTPHANKPIIWIDAGIHAREWIAPATAIYVIDKLIKDHDSNVFVRYLLSRFTVFILPLANPDGYAYTWETDRLWRKTRSIHSRSSCRGADPNRNWGFHWAGHGTSNDPCSENFHGKGPFSEPETRAISRFLYSLRERLTIYLTLHSYGQYWLTPWGFTYEVPHDYSDMINLGQKAASVLRDKTGSNYQVGASSRLLYLAAGGSDDWVKGVLGVKYSYTVELRDTGEHGFVLPASFIDATGGEMLEAIITLALEVTRPSAPA